MRGGEKGSEGGQKDVCGMKTERLLRVQRSSGGREEGELASRGRKRKNKNIFCMKNTKDVWD